MKKIICLVAWLELMAPGIALATPSIPLDYLGGEWTIHNPSGEPVGTSKIDVDIPGMMIHELRIVGEDGPQHLWFAYSERAEGWTQLFAGGADAIREFLPQPSPDPQGLVLGANVKLRDGTPVRFRMTMTNEGPDRANRILEMSRDAGVNWATVFDYRYRRKASPR